MPKTIGQILRESQAFCQAHLTPLLAGAVAFGVILGATQGLVAQPMMGQEQMDRLERMAEQMEQQMNRARSGDATALNDLANDARGLGGEAAAAMSMGFSGILTLFVFALLSIAISIAVGCVSSSYALAVVIRRINDIGLAWQSCLQWLWPFVGVWWWTFLKSYAWIPLLGIIVTPFLFPVWLVVGLILGVVMGPRFVAAPVLLIEQGKTPREAVMRSQELCRSQWARIAVPMIVCGLIGIVGTMIAGLVINMLSGWMEMIAEAIVGQLFAYWLTVVGVVIARDVLATPAPLEVSPAPQIG